MATAVAGERFELGRVMARASGAVRRNAVLFLLLAAILQFGPALLFRVLTPPPVFVPGQMPDLGIGYGVSILVSVLLYYVTMAAVTHVTVVDLKDEKPTLGPALARGVRLAIPLFGLAIVSGFALMFGFLLLVVPGIILGLMWIVAVPVMVEEGTGVFASLGRSRALTRGARWRIFLLMLALLLTFYLVVFAASAVFGTVSLVGGDSAAAASASIGGTGIGAVVITIINAVFVIGITALIAAMYVELRYVRDGVAGTDVAAVFD